MALTSSYSATKATMTEVRLDRKRLEKLAAPNEVRIRTCLRQATGTPENTEGQCRTVSHGHSWGLSTELTQHGVIT